MLAVDASVLMAAVVKSIELDFSNRFVFISIVKNRNLKFLLLLFFSNLFCFSEKKKRIEF